MKTEKDYSFEAFKKSLSYDPETGILKWKIRSGRACIGSPAGYIDKNGYISIRFNEKQFRAHRVAWLLSTEFWPFNQIDHLNGIRTDNRLCNLRDVVQSDNQRNRKAPKHNTSGTMGVSWDKTERKWRVRAAGFDHKRKHLGLFSDKKEAVNFLIDFKSDPKNRYILRNAQPSKEKQMENETKRDRTRQLVEEGIANFGHLSVVNGNPSEETVIGPQGPIKEISQEDINDVQSGVREEPEGGESAEGHS